MKDFYSSSWLNGEYIDIAGFKVCITSSLSFASFESLHDNSTYVFQGDEADTVIQEMNLIYEQDELTQDEAIGKWIRMHL